VSLLSLRAHWCSHVRGSCRRPPILRGRGPVDSCLGSGEPQPIASVAHAGGSAACTAQCLAGFTLSFASGFRVWCWCRQQASGAFAAGPAVAPSGEPLGERQSSTNTSADDGHLQRHHGHWLVREPAIPIAPSPQSQGRGPQSRLPPSQIRRIRSTVLKNPKAFVLPHTAC
jgi:hypothetical protein